MIKQIAAAVLMAATSVAASAAEPTGFYLGADVGKTKIEGFENDNSVGVFAGYKFNENIAVEAGYRNLGDFNLLGYDVEAKQTALSVIGSLPVGVVSVYGRLGYNKLEAKVRGYSADDNGTVVGLGVSYPITKEVSARVEFQRPSSDTKNLSVGISYNF